MYLPLLFLTSVTLPDNLLRDMPATFFGNFVLRLSAPCKTVSKLLFFISANAPKQKQRMSQPIANNFLFSTSIASHC
ncbi:hypothetical protein CW304_24190 [Bacillus sp. UFRGS-B20]|nr:hypothetical protein CW304_24190 [Bacillus sp. UFRGS-B20]